MKRDLEGLSANYDLVIVGGGIYGACIARDASMRGLKVALLEQGDFGHATSHNSYKLIHGGLRYLQHFDLRRVLECIRETYAWFTIAPHLVRPLRFVMPIYGHGIRGKKAMTIAMSLHEALRHIALRRSRVALPLKRGGTLSASDTRALFPEITTSALMGVAYWYDGQMLDANRLVFECIEDASRHGAHVLNYVQVCGLLKNSAGVAGVQARDEMLGKEFEVQTKLVINATGPWTNNVLALHGHIRPVLSGQVKGMSLVTSRLLDSEDALCLASNEKSDAVLGQSSRLYFITPWRGRSVIGTTHEPYQGAADGCVFNEEDVSRFVGEVNAACPALGLSMKQILYCYVGLTPAEEGKRSRRHLITDHAVTDGVDGILSVLGVKFTSARVVAEKVVDHALRKLGSPHVVSNSATSLLPGVSRHFESTLAEPRTQEFGVGKKEFQHRCREAVDEEMAVHLDDVLVRRIGVVENGELSEFQIERCARLMQERLGWSEQRTQEEIRLAFRYLHNIDDDQMCFWGVRGKKI